MKLRLIILAALGISFNAQAIHIDMKPGLWEHKFKMDEAGASAIQKEQIDQMNKAMAEMKKQLENMPPDQRKMMEEMMAKNGMKVSDSGIEMSGNQSVKMSKDGTIVKVCVTQEDIDNGEMPKADSNCEQKITQSSARVVKVSYVCKGDHPTQGEGEIVFDSDKSYTGKLTYTAQMNDKPETFHVTQSGQWLSSDCGTIKPHPYKESIESKKK